MYTKNQISQDSDMKRLLMAGLSLISACVWAVPYKLDCVPGRVVCAGTDCTTIIFENKTEKRPMHVEGVLVASLHGAAKLLSDGLFEFTEVLEQPLVSCHIDTGGIIKKAAKNVKVEVSLNEARCEYHISKKNVAGNNVYDAVLATNGDSCAITR